MTRRTALFVFLVALAVRFVYLAAIYDGPASLRAIDSLLFEHAAAGIVLTGRLVVQSDTGTERPFVERGPGYAGWLAVLRAGFGESLLIPATAQVLLGAITCVLVGLLAGLLNRRIAAFAGLLAAINVNMIAHAPQISIASLLLFFLLGAMVLVGTCFRRSSGAAVVGAGVLFGAALLIAPVFEFFVPLLAVGVAAAAWRRGPTVAVLHVLVLVAAVAIVVGPFYVSNAREFGFARLSAGAGQSGFTRLAPAALELGAGLPRAEAAALLEDRLKTQLAAQQRAALPENPFAASAEFRAVTMSALADAGAGPLLKAWVSGIALNMAAPSIVAARPVQLMDRPHFWPTPGVNAAHKAWNYVFAKPGYAILVVPAIALTLLLRLVAATALFQMPHRLAPAPFFLPLALGVYALVASGPVVDLAARLPFEPVLCVLLAAGLVWFADRWSQSGPLPKDPFEHRD